MSVTRVTVNIRPWQRKLLEEYRDEYEYTSLSGATRAALAEWARLSPWAQSFLEHQAATPIALDSAVLESTKEKQIT